MNTTYNKIILLIKTVFKKSILFLFAALFTLLILLINYQNSESNPIFKIRKLLGHNIILPNVNELIILGLSEYNQYLKSTDMSNIPVPLNADTFITSITDFTYDIQVINILYYCNILNKRGICYN